MKIDIKMETNEAFEKFGLETSLKQYNVYIDDKLTFKDVTEQHIKLFFSLVTKASVQYDVYLTNSYE